MAMMFDEEEAACRAAKQLNVPAESRAARRGRVGGAEPNRSVFSTGARGCRVGDVKVTRAGRRDVRQMLRFGSRAGRPSAS
ncbi:hypothetical protein EYF80_049197 [Liparis tanakae]|uniref:Uncharacterized protein n=1 Tax=Liparis tanakae TaxID=230148 RepID=A0A4Z2FIN4_9TELE|nr:hypothetical protein EYF80_049197 [Liparis tanakae]